MKLGNSHFVSLITGDKQLSTSDKFVEANLPQVELLSLTWVALATDWKEEAGEYITHLLAHSRSLSSAINHAQIIADHLIKVAAGQTNEGETVVLEDGWMEMDFSLFEGDDLRGALQVLRFPKRFTYLEADNLDKLTTQKFWGMQHEDRMKNISLPTRWATSACRVSYLELIQEEAAALFKSYLPISPDPIRRGVDSGLGAYSTGHTCDCPDGDKRVATKLTYRAFPMDHNLRFPYIQKAPVVRAKEYLTWYSPDPGSQYAEEGWITTSHSAWDDREKIPANYAPGITWPHGYGIVTATSYLLPVPKNYKIGRGIVEENSSRQFFLEAIRKSLWNCISYSSQHDYTDWKKTGRGSSLCFSRRRGIEIDQQDQNQLAAFTGSIDGGYATIDSTSFSDSICFSAARLILPPAVFRDVASYRALYVTDASGVARLNHMWLTSGAACTHLSEGSILLSVARAAYRIVEMWGTNVSDFLPPLVFGDDLAIDARVFETMRWLMELLGFHINPEKTFIEGPYKESCGVEYLDGQPMDSSYWPRKGLDLRFPTPEVYATLVDLQHRFYEYKPVREYLARWFESRLGKRQTFSTPFSPNADIGDPWAPIPWSLKVPEFAHYERGKGVVVDVWLDYHLTTKSSPEDPGKGPNYDAWIYAAYLREGPLPHADPVLKEAGCTQSRLTSGQFMKPKLIFGFNH
jgi:hypothetical protein